MRIDKQDYHRTGKTLSEKFEIKPECCRLLEGKVAIITGANLGIGLACAIRFVQEGAKVVITGRQDEVGYANEEFIRSCGGDCTYFHCDAFSRSDVKETIKGTIKKYGRIDILVNNAGYNIPARFEDATPSQFRQMVGVHGLAHCYMIWEVYPHMKEQGGGVILEFGSKSTVKPSLRDPFYCFAKAGIGQLTKCLNLEFGRDNIRINCIGPGAVFTGMTMTDDGKPVPGFTRLADFSPRGYLAWPEEMAKTVVWLCSDESDYVSGQTLCSDGGLVT
jgi:NAD(P)-dependent dehydrogenase (short-subunit alcohol dehydrogenase family)